MLLTCYWNYRSGVSRRTINIHMVQRLYAVVRSGDASVLLQNRGGARRSREIGGIYSGSGRQGVRCLHRGCVAAARRDYPPGHGRLGARVAVFSRWGSVQEVGRSGSAGRADGGKRRGPVQRRGRIRRRDTNRCSRVPGGDLHARDSGHSSSNDAAGAGGRGDRR